MTTKINLLGLDRVKLSELFASWGEPAYRAQQIIQWLHQGCVVDVAQMSNLSKKIRQRLLAETEIVVPKLKLERVAADGTRKWLIQLADGNAIETVYIPEPQRATLCISSQVGCALNCSFCATGKEGFNRNLSLAEIIGQLWFAKNYLAQLGLQSVTNVVMMGMGEPLLNYEPVVSALRLMLDDHAYGLSQYRVTLSTSGVLPPLLQLFKDVPVALAVSLHAATDELRNQLVPLNKKYPLKQLMAVCRDYFPKGSKRGVTFEYVMLQDVNDSLTDAGQLVKLLQGIRCKLNLIPFNSFPGTRYQRSSDEAIAKFQRYLIDAGVSTWVRRTRGEDVEGACGQLAGKIQDRTGRHQRWLRTGYTVPVSALKKG